MANEVLTKTGTALIFADATYSPGTNTTLGTRTDDIDVANLSSDAARQSVKADLGAVRAAQFSVDMTVEPATDPAAGGTIDLYWSESHSATAAVGNIAGTSGADAAYTGYATMTLQEGLDQMIFIGSLLLGVQNDVDGVQIGHVGVFSPKQRYGVLVVHNNSSVALHSDSVEFAVRLSPVVDEIQ